MWCSQGPYRLDVVHFQSRWHVGFFFADGHPGQTASCSWWPKQSMWEISGLNVGYWTVDDEEWFQKYLRHLKFYSKHNGKFPCYSAAEWWCKLRFSNVTKQMVVHLREKAEEWLTTNCGL